MTQKKRPIVFISYSWDSAEHKNWVLKLSNDLISDYGVDVLLDQYELSAGKDFIFFMETSLEKASKILMILTPNYKIKAESRTGGTGFEYSMISQELFEVQASSNKFIPILRSGDLSISAPKYLKTKIYHPMNDDDKYLNSLNDLGRWIYERPALKKPEPGPIPDFDNPTFDPIIKLAHEIESKESFNLKLNKILNSKEGIEIANMEVKNLIKAFREKAILYNNNTNINFRIQEDYGKGLIISSLGFSVELSWHQALLNTIDDSKLSLTYWYGSLSLDDEKYYYFQGTKPIKADETVFSFDFDNEGKRVWRISNDNTKPSAQIVSESFLFIMESILKEKQKDFRK
jgi:hypothetical protein